MRGDVKSVETKYGNRHLSFSLCVYNYAVTRVWGADDSLDPQPVGYAPVSEQASTHTARHPIFALGRIPAELQIETWGAT